MLFIIAHRLSAAWLFLVFVLTLLHVCLCFLGCGQKLQQLLPPSPPLLRQHQPSLHNFQLDGTNMSRSSTRTRLYFNRHNQSDNNGNSEHQQHHQKVVVDQTNNVESSDTTKPVLFVEPLDVILARARKRSINPLYKIQAFLDTRIKGVPWLTFGDAIFCLVAMSIGANGFALGLLLGKWSSSSLATMLPVTTKQGIPPMLVQFYPVLLAIILDQWIS